MFELSKRADRRKRKAFLTLGSPWGHGGTASPWNCSSVSAGQGVGREIGVQDRGQKMRLDRLVSREWGHYLKARG